MVGVEVGEDALADGLADVVGELAVAAKAVAAEVVATDAPSDPSSSVTVRG